jgi:hypothetical protein
MEDKIQKPEGFGKTAILPKFTRGQALIWKRDPAPEGHRGTLRTNVQWKVREHSPDGFEIGYSGSGPADLALNAMAALFLARGADRVEKCFDGSVSHKAWLLHQPFKFKFLANAHRDEGRIEWAEIQNWLEDQERRLEIEKSEKEAIIKDAFAFEVNRRLERA